MIDFLYWIVSSQCSYFLFSAILSFSLNALLMIVDLICYFYIFINLHFPFSLLMRLLFHFAAILSFSLNALLIVTLMKVPRQLTHLELCLINLAAGSCVPSLTSYPIIASACYSHRWLFGPIGKYVKVLIWKVKCGRHGWLFGSTVSAQTLNVM